MKLMPGCGKDKYLTTISWKLPILASKAFISCIFPKNITIFCDFLEKHMYAPCFQSKHSSHGLEKVLKMPTFSQKKDIFHIPKWFTFTFPMKKAVLNWFWCFPFRTYIYTTISIKKFFVKWFNNTEKTKLKFLVCHQ